MRGPLQPASTRLRAVAVCGALCGALACASDTTSNPEITAWAELGAGELDFTPLRADDALPYVAGAQGGHHVFISLRMQGLDPKRVHLRVTTAIEGRADRVLTREGRVNFAPEHDRSDASDLDDTGAEGPSTQRYVYAGWPAQILMAPCHVDEHVHLEVMLTDLTMRQTKAHQIIRIARGSGPTPSCAPATPP